MRRLLLGICIISGIGVCDAYQWRSEGRTMIYGMYSTHEPYYYPYTCAMWKESGGIQVKIQNLYYDTRVTSSTKFTGLSRSAPVLEIPSTIIIVPFDENEKLWESTPLVSDGPCDMHTPELMLEKKKFDVLSLYRIEPRPYEEMEAYKYEFYYDSDYSNSLSLDSYCEYMIYDVRLRYEKIKNSRYSFSWGFESVVLPVSLKHIADSACVGVVEIETPLVVTENVEYIGDMAFCCGDFDVDMSQAKSLTHIGVKAMYAMSAKEIVVPESVKEVGELAFGPALGVLKALDYEGRTACLFPPYYLTDGSFVREYTKDVSYQAEVCLERLVSKNPEPPAIVMEYKRDEDTGELTDEPLRTEPILCHPEFSSRIPLYVPDGSVDAYRSAPGWKNFTQIYTLSDLEASGIDNVSSDIQAVETGRYDINGRPVDGEYRGVVVVRYSDGSVRKELAR
ncbi:leucine-rich repeat protein [Muribaculum intestinale]|uniref:leucine-rich repeat protein n=3 Tax=Muribaculum intestinale TaxID=1796646 RepID=UPI0025B58A58|nr:leucine-rich repeat protein [Muribaculum intestinale]